MSANWATAPTELSLRVPNWAAQALFGRSVSNAYFLYLVSGLAGCSIHASRTASSRRLARWTDGDLAPLGGMGFVGQIVSPDVTKVLLEHGDQRTKIFRP